MLRPRCCVRTMTPVGDGRIREERRIRDETTCSARRPAPDHARRRIRDETTSRARRLATNATSCDDAARPTRPRGPPGTERPPRAVLPRRLERAYCSPAVRLLAGVTRLLLGDSGDPAAGAETNVTPADSPVSPIRRTEVHEILMRIPLLSTEVGTYKVLPIRVTLYARCPQHLREQCPQHCLFTVEHRAPWGVPELPTVAGPRESPTPGAFSCPPKAREPGRRGADAWAHDAWSLERIGAPACRRMGAQVHRRADDSPLPQGRRAGVSTAGTGSSRSTRRRRSRRRGGMTRRRQEPAAASRRRRCRPRSVCGPT